MGKLAIIAFGLIFLFYPHLSAEIEKDITDPKVFESYHKFWSTFEKRQQKSIQSNQEQIKNSWDKIFKEHQREIFKVNSKKIEELIKAAGRYRMQLKAYPNASNKPDVLLNLSQVLYVIYENMVETDVETSQTYLNESLKSLEQIIEEFKYYERRDYAIFLQANIYGDLGYSDQSMKAWLTLSNLRYKTKYRVYAYTAIGDYYFYRDDSVNATKFYKKSLLHKDQLKSENLLMLEYRLAWSFYRVGELNNVIEIAKEIFKPNKELGNFNDQSLLMQDIIEITGDAMYEMSDSRANYFDLDFRVFNRFAPSLGLYLVRRFLDIKEYSKVIKIADSITQLFPISKETPELLYLLSKTYSKIHLNNNSYEALEKLSLFLPLNSLWRTTFKYDLKAISNMEKLAFEATIHVANWHFTRGMNSNLQKHFLSAASFYSIALDHSPFHDNSIQWELAKAHCYYYSGQLQEAGMQYAKLMENKKLNEDILETAAYQSVLVKEKIWRNVFLRSLEEGIDVYHNDLARHSLEQVAAAADSYVRIFPDKPRAVELLLIVATANRDQGHYEQALKFWNKVLTMKPSAYQRQIAIRGIVFANIKKESSLKVVEVLRRFLDVEDWTSLGRSFRMELLTLLSQTLLDAGKKLNESGKLAQSGELLISVAKEFKKLPNRSKIIKNGAYFLAISGRLNDAENAAKFYMKTSHKKHLADIVYLLARVNEYKFKFGDAAKIFWKLYKEHPKHNKIYKSLIRAEKLAKADNLYELSAKISMTLGKLSKKIPKKLSFYQSAIKSYWHDEMYRKAIEASKLMLKVSKYENDKMTAKLLLSRSYIKNKQNSNAINVLNSILEKEKYLKNKIGVESWNQVKGQAHLVLLNLYNENFSHIELWSKKRNVTNLYQRKLRYYNKLKYHAEKAMSTKNFSVSIHARFKLADASERFSDQMSSMIASLEHNKNTIPKIYREKVRDLKKLSQKMFGKNVVLGAKIKRSDLSDQEWIAKSYWRLTKSHDIDSQPFKNLIMPHAIHYDLPYQWSL